ncbi:MAG: hypothetical protein ABR543_15695 [Gemmatimonadaceae bacterium]
MRITSSTVIIIGALSLSAAVLDGQDRESDLSVERIFEKREFSGARIPGFQWMKDGVSYIDQRPDSGGGSDIIRVNAGTGEVSILAAASALAGADGKRLNIEEIRLSEDESKALLFHSSVRVWRTNTRGVYHVLDSRASRSYAGIARRGVADVRQVLARRALRGFCA